MRRLLHLVFRGLVALSVGCDSGGGGADTSPDVQLDAQPDTSPDGAGPELDTAPSTLGVLSTVPEGGAVVSPVAPIVVTFDLALERVTLSDDTVKLKAGDTTVTGTHTVEGAVYTFTPDAPLTNDTEHTLTLTTGVRASAGGPSLSEPVVLNFKTMAGMRVVSVEPADGATNVATSSAVRVVFDRPVLSRTVGNRRLGLNNTGDLPIVAAYDGGTSFDWYVVYLNDGKSLGSWNRAANKALRDNGANAATVETWQGTLGQGFQAKRYGGTNGRDEPYVSPFDYTLTSNAMAEGQCLRAEITTSGLVALFARPDNGHTSSLWYFVRGPRK
ncbi:MAG TPA: Ig-like domain-containing protein [Myxococcota bacterium]|nr:Ig-like domain-containing protein [Myxococcota bacterium]